MSLTWIEISKSALLHNVSAYRNLIGKTKLMAVVKSNAYGHGLDLVSDTINEFVDWFGVVNGREAIELRDQGINKPILVLSYYDEDLVDELLRKNISVVVYDLDQIKKLDVVAGKLKTKAKIHLKLDTGTSRLGQGLKDTVALALEIKRKPNVVLEGLMSHLAASEDNAGYTSKQLQEFENAIKEFESLGITFHLKHIACSASAAAFPKGRFDLVRIGIGIYGLSSYKTASKNPALNLNPVLEWKTKIIHIKKVPKNAYVGYSCTYKTKQLATLAVIPVGYFEGYDRKLSNAGQVLIGGVKCPVRGRICMNLTIVDVTKVPGAKVGDEAVLIGQQGKQTVTADDLAKKIGTINYEVVSRLNLSISRSLTP